MSTADFYSVWDTGYVLFCFFVTLFCIVKAIFAPAILDRPATMYGIAIAHSVFNILCTAMLLPAGNLLEKLAIMTVPDSPADKKQENTLLDDRLLTTRPWPWAAPC